MGCFEVPDLSGTFLVYILSLSITVVVLVLFSSGGYGVSFMPFFGPASWGWGSSVVFDAPRAVSSIRGRETCYFFVCSTPSIELVSRDFSRDPFSTILPASREWHSPTSSRVFVRLEDIPSASGVTSLVVHGHLFHGYFGLYYYLYGVKLDRGDASGNGTCSASTLRFHGVFKTSSTSYSCEGIGDLASFLGFVI